MVLSFALSEDRTFLFLGIEADNFRIGWKIRRNWQWALYIIRPSNIGLLSNGSVATLTLPLQVPQYRSVIH